jgi:hypothetical protein
MRIKVAVEGIVVGHEGWESLIFLTRMFGRGRGISGGQLGTKRKVREVEEATKVGNGEGGGGNQTLVEVVNDNDEVMCDRVAVDASMEFAVNAVKMGVVGCRVQAGHHAWSW